MMKIYKREKYSDQAYSLHDASIINIYRDGDDLVLETDYGYVDIKNNTMVYGNIRIKDVSFDDSYVYTMAYKKVLCGNPGKFKGKKMELGKFIKKFKKTEDKVEIVEESQAYRRINLSGFIMKKDKIKEIFLDIYYLGDFVYEIEE